MTLSARVLSTYLTLFMSGASLAAPIGSAEFLDSVCPRPAPGSSVPDLPYTRSQSGLLSTHLVARNVGLGPEEPVMSYDYRFCLLEHDNPQRQSPVLRAKPGDWVKLELENRMSPQDGFSTPHVHTIGPLPARNSLVPASIATVNLHYHGLNIPPTYGADDVLSTIIPPDSAAPGDRSTFGYHFRIPSNDPPGLFWYHPHIHGTAQQQLLGGMTGVLIVDGMERFFPELKGLRERVLVLRDMDKPDPADNPNAPADEPWKNVSINSVPILYGSDLLPTLEMGAGERQFWRVANASADTHFVLQLQFNPKGTADGWESQNLELIARDGVPFLADHGKARGRALIVNQIVLPPAGRAEFIVTGPSSGIAARFYSADYNEYLAPQSANCAPGFPDSVCDNTDRNPSRTLASIVTTSTALRPRTKAATPMLAATGQLRRFAQLTGHKIDKSRRLFFTKDPSDDGNFFITVAGQVPKPFDMTGPPDITVHGPTIEEWTIENRDNESHDFHIHQIHFRVMEVNGVPTDDRTEHVLRDTIELGACRKWADGIDPQNDPYGLTFPPSSSLNDQNFTGKNCVQPSTVRLRMDFRDRNIVGTFLYHCHILEHEDHGMMAKIRLN